MERQSRNRRSPPWSADPIELPIGRAEMTWEPDRSLQRERNGTSAPESGIKVGGTREYRKERSLAGICRLGNRSGEYVLERAGQGVSGRGGEYITTCELVDFSTRILFGN